LRHFLSAGKIPNTDDRPVLDLACGIFYRGKILGI